MYLMPDLFRRKLNDEYNEEHIYFDMQPCSNELLISFSIEYMFIFYPFPSIFFTLNT